MRLLLLLLISSGAFAQAPKLFFTDLTVGPNSGGETVSGFSGAYVTLYGNNFGTTQGASTVTLNGAQSVRVVSWGSTYLWYQKIVVQLGSSSASGNFQVTTSAGSSNTLPFTVATGHIYFVATTGNDSSGTGSFASPWRTIPKAKNSINPGDIAYVENGVTQTAIDDYNSGLAITSQCSSTAPCALVVYPGAAATIGSNTPQFGLRNPQLNGQTANDWVIAGFTVTGSGSAMDLWHDDGYRIVGNEMFCPEGAGQAACFHTDTLTNTKFLGNYVHNVGDQNGSIDKFYHAVYFTTNTTGVEAAWNLVVPNPNGVTTSGGCRAIQFFSTGGSDQFDLHVHDNTIHDAICDGINFSTVNPTNGTVEAYNNVVYHVGTGPDPANGGSNYTCIYANTSQASTGTVQIYNNTLYDCGARVNSGGTSDTGAIGAGMNVNLRNNIVSLTGSEVYYEPSAGASCTNLSGSNNLWFGAGTVTTCTTANINSSDPKFTSTSTKDFHLQSSSPAKDAGVTISSLLTDHDGLTRPQGAAYDIGAYEFSSGGSSPSTSQALTGKIQLLGRVVAGP